MPNMRLDAVSFYEKVGVLRMPDVLFTVGVNAEARCLFTRKRHTL